jgi:D-alanyl-D-alanine dipeptidase
LIVYFQQSTFSFFVSNERKTLSIFSSDIFIVNVMKIFLSLLIFSISASFGQEKKPQPPGEIPPFSKSLQAVVVTTGGWQATKGEARLFERKNAKSGWKLSGEAFPVVVGRAGLAWGAGLNALPTDTDRSAHKAEGDGKAPAGIFALSSAFGSEEKPPFVKLPYQRLEEFTECVDDAASTHYNKIVHRLRVGIFDWKSSEKMLEIGDQYALGVFVEHNFERRPGAGSCIFFHVWKDADSPTAGCTAMARPDMEKVLAFLDPKKNPVLIQLPADSYEQFQKKWNLPKLRNK